MQWQPIATAPKDGTIIRLRDKQGIYSTVMAWNKKLNQWEGITYSTMGTHKTHWDESFVPILEWRHVDGQ